MRGTNDIKLRIAKNFRGMIERRNLTPNAFAVKCGISDGTVYNYLAGVTSPSMAMAFRMAEGLGEEPMKLMSEIVEGAAE